MKISNRKRHRGGENIINQWRRLYTARPYVRKSVTAWREAKIGRENLEKSGIGGMKKSWRRNQQRCSIAAAASRISIARQRL